MTGDVKSDSFIGAFEDRVATECYRVYSSLGKKGKPQVNREWTNMACVVKTNDVQGKAVVEVVTLATGTKCIGENHRTDTGMLLNDSHAEVLARRLFLKYLYKQIELVTREPANSIFTRGPLNNTYSLRPAIRFHLFSTDSPCGDASIFPKKESTELNTNDNNHKRRYLDNDVGTVIDAKRICIKENKCKRDANDNSTSLVSECRNLEGAQQPKQEEEEEEEEQQQQQQQQHQHQHEQQQQQQQHKEQHKQQQQHKHSPGKIVYDSSNDIHRTGAKCVPGGTQDLLEPGDKYHVTGALRIKPGRGDRTLSMSCSDKIMKWCHLGLQGGFLSNFLSEPIYLSTVILSATECSEEAVHRAISGRGRTPSSTLDYISPAVLHSKLSFVDCKDNVEEKCGIDNNGKLTPAGVSILWCGECNIHELTSNGRKHGITKKHMHTEKASTSICKKQMFKDFIDTFKLDNCDGVTRGLDATGVESLSSYRDWKHRNEKYKARRREFFNIFPEWTSKPVEHEGFTLAQ